MPITYQIFRDQLLSGISNVSAGIFGKNNTYGIPVQNQSEIKNIKNDFSETINLLVNNSKAYLTSSFISSLSSGNALGVAAGIASSLLNALTARQYWTADEYAAIVATNYDTLSSGSSDSDITIKTFTGKSTEGKDFDPFTGTTVSIPYKQDDNTGQWKLGNKSQTLITDVKSLEYNIKYPIDTDLQTMINTLAKKSTSIGFIYVKPVTSTTSETYTPFKIPFEFNPVVSEGAVEARYNAVSLLSRIGDLRAYVGTSPLTVTIKTDYLITTDITNNYSFSVQGENINPYADTGLSTIGTAIPSTFKNPTTGSNTPGATGTDDHYAKWMDYYNERIIYGIETAYRSLVLPDFSASTSNNITYVRPPIVKIIMSSDKDPSANNEGDIYELAYPIFGSSGNPYTSRNILASQANAKFNYHKSFVVTGLSINKSFETNNAYYDTNGALRFNGFSVELTLAEVTQSYTDIMPDFSVYQKRFSQFATLGTAGSDALFASEGT